MLLLISFQIQYMAGLIDFLGKFKRFGDAAGIPVPAVCFDGLLVAALQLLLVEFQRRGGKMMAEKFAKSFVAGYDNYKRKKAAGY